MAWKLICFDAKQASGHVPFYEKQKKTASEYMQKIKKCIVFIRSSHKKKQQQACYPLENRKSYQN